MSATVNAAEQAKRPVQKRRQPGAHVESPEEAQGRLTRKLFTVYNQYSPFREQLRIFSTTHASALERMEAIGRRDLSFGTAQTHAGTAPLIAQYVDSLKAIANHWGLDRLSDDQGLDALHAWCQLFWAKDGDDTGLAFGAGHTICSTDSGADTSVTVGGHTDHWRIDDEPRDDQEVLVPEDRIQRIGLPPSARARIINGQTRWVIPIEGARTRIQTAAEKTIGRRLTAAECSAIDEQLTRIEAEAAAVAYVHPDTAPREDTHLKWLFQRLAPVGNDGKPLGVWKIAQNEQLAADLSDDPVTEKTIRNETDALRRQLGIKGFPKAPRKPEPTRRSKSRP
jgi:hypothetical protein